MVFDCETGGLPAKNPSLLTLYGVLLDERLKVISKIDLKIKPNDGVYRIEPRALDINGINLKEHDEQAIVETEAADLFKNFICKYNINNKVVPVGHNVSFDVVFAQRLLNDSDFWRQKFTKRVIDTATIAGFFYLSGIFPDQNDLDCSLKGLAERFDFPYEGAHEAKFDVNLTIKVLKKFLELAKNKERTQA